MSDDPSNETLLALRAKIVEWETDPAPGSRLTSGVIPPSEDVRIVDIIDAALAARAELADFLVSVANWKGTAGDLRRAAKHMMAGHPSKIAATLTYLQARLAAAERCVEVLRLMVNYYAPLQPGSFQSIIRHSQQEPTRLAASSALAAFDALGPDAGTPEQATIPRGSSDAPEPAQETP